MAFWKTLASIPKVARWNNDQKQQKLAGLLAVAGESDSGERAGQVAVVIEEFIKEARWGSNEAEERIAHALSLVQAQKHWNPDIFEKARLIGFDIIQRLAGATQDTARAEMKAEFGTENLGPEKSEEIGQAIVALIEAKGVRTYHAAIGILMTTVTVLMRRLPPSNPKEQLRQAMVRWVEGM